MSSKSSKFGANDENSSSPEKSKQTTLDSLAGEEATPKKTTEKRTRKKTKKSSSQKDTVPPKEHKPSLLEKYQKNLAIYRDMEYKEGEAETHILMGREYLGSGSLSRAEFHVTKGIEIYEEIDLVEELADAFELMGDVKTEMESETAVDDYRNAKRLFDELKAVQRKRIVLVKMAEAYLKHGQYKESLDRFMKAQGINETNEIILSTGLCHEKLGDVDKALHLYTSALDKFSDDERSTALVRIGDLYLTSKKRETLAEESYRKAEAIPGFVNQARAQSKLGQFYFQKKDYEKALEYLRKALDNTEKTGDRDKARRIQLSLCELYHLLGEDGEALLIYKRMLKTLPEKEKPDILGKTIAIYKKLGNDDELLKALKQQAALHSSLGQMADLIEAYQQMETLYEKMGAKTKLLENFQETAKSARELEDTILEADYHSKIERYHIEQGHINKQKDFTTQMEEYYFQLGEPDAAIHFFEKSWELHQEKGMLHHQARDAMDLGKFYMSMADHKKAEEWFRKADALFSQLKDRQMRGTVNIYLGTIKKNLGTSTMNTGLYDETIDFYLTAQKHFQAAGDELAVIKVNSYIETIYDLKARAIHGQRATVIEEMNKLGSKIGNLEGKNEALKVRIKDIGVLLEEGHKNSEEMSETLTKMRKDMKSARSEKKEKQIHIQTLALEKSLQKGKETRLRLKKELRESEDAIASNEHTIRGLREELRGLEQESSRLKEKIIPVEDRALEYHLTGREKNPLMSSLTKLEEVESEIYSHLAQGKVPAMVFPTRTKTNIEFDERSNVFKLGSLTTRRSAKSVAGASMLLRTSYVIDFIRSMIDSTFQGKPRSSTLREMYYISESWGKLGKFDTQDSSNQVIEDLEVVTKWMREHFKLRPEEDGARLIGDITINERNRKGKWKKINCKDDVGDSGYTIPYNVEKDKLEFKKVNTNFLVAIETGGMFDRLVENGFDEAFNCTIIHTKGQPARSTRRFIKRMSEELKIPVYCFTDGDPWSYRIFASIAYGAIKTAHISEYLATPTAEFIGITPSDIINYELPADKLSSQDINALKTELTDPRFKDSFWQSEIKAQLQMGKKSEQQALAKYGLDFVTDTYLPEKLQEMDMEY